MHATEGGTTALSYSTHTSGTSSKGTPKCKFPVRGGVCALQDHQINEPKWDAWKVLPEAVRTGQVAFALAHGGLDMHEVGASCSSDVSPVLPLPSSATPEQLHTITVDR